MRRIDRDTVQKILDTANIVDVVSDFVSLKRRGANYIGLCPFHNERTPSFSVSPSKGICKCFSCGKGGSAVGFLMELEQMSYNEALRYIAKKYGIEINDHEMSSEEREAESERESMMAVNEFAMKFFEHSLTETEAGRDIGLAYFRERGINDAMIKRFHLGYSPEQRDALVKKASSKGFADKYLLDTGLCYNSEHGLRDRFRGRVIYPVFTVSGKVVAFGGRTLRKDKDIAKYVNSPESVIYRKSYELYGLYQAKQAIVRKDKCILVEGYMDVISMHQAGIENVVASSGTSLTEGQIRLIHRFTQNVTVIYDSDAAGIKASLRGIDLLLAEGLDIKVLLLPDGDDPDSFAQSHSSAEVEAYIAEHEQDFIAFKTGILMQGIENDPIARSRAIQSIVKSISVIPNPITRNVYVNECSRSMGIDEKVLNLQIAKYSADAAERKAAEEQRERNRVAAGLPANPAEDATAVLTPIVPQVRRAQKSKADNRPDMLRPYEEEILRYAVRYGMCFLCDVALDEEGNTRPMSVLEYIVSELRADEISFANMAFTRILELCMELSGNWESDYAREAERLASVRAEKFTEGIDEIRRTVEDMSSITVRERSLNEKLDAMVTEELEDFASSYLQKRLLSSPDDAVRVLTAEMVISRYSLSKIHTKYSKISTERDRLPELVPLAIYNLKCALIECEIQDVNAELASFKGDSSGDMSRIRELMERSIELNTLKKELSVYLGERILSPKIR